MLMFVFWEAIKQALGHILERVFGVVLSLLTYGKNISRESCGRSFFRDIIFFSSKRRCMEIFLGKVLGEVF